MNDVKIVNDVNRALVVMNQAADWAQKKGLSLPIGWNKDRLTSDKMIEKFGADAKFLVFEIDGQDAGAGVLTTKDIGNCWGKYGYAGKHYYVNKFAVADKFHGGDYSRKMLDAIKAKAVVDGVDSIRADADIKIAPFYVNNGFFPHWSFYGKRNKRDFVRLAWYRWTPEEFETIWRGAGRFNLRRFVYRAIKRLLWFL